MQTKVQNLGGKPFKTPLEKEDFLVHEGSILFYLR